jgi:hypothetical protein
MISLNSSLKSTYILSNFLKKFIYIFKILILSGIEIPHSL